MDVVVYLAPPDLIARMVKEFLSQKGISFTEKDVSLDRLAAQEFMDKTGQMSVPVNVSGGETIVGFNRSRLEEA
jgi:glutaredoxin